VKKLKACREPIPSLSLLHFTSALDSSSCRSSRAFVLFLLDFYIPKNVKETKNDRCAKSSTRRSKRRMGNYPLMKIHLELEIRTLQNAPRDADKLRRLLEIRQRQKDEAMHIEDTQRLVTEIEMLKVILFFW
jgi:hypothetical protein